MTGLLTATCGMQLDHLALTVGHDPLGVWPPD